LPADFVLLRLVAYFAELCNFHDSELNNNGLKTKSSMSDYTIFPIGDAAITIDFGNRISETLNKKVMAMQTWLHQHPFEGLIDVIIAYSSLSIIYDPGILKMRYRPPHSIFEYMKAKLTDAYLGSSIYERDQIVKRIPVCYDPAFGLDLDYVASEKQIDIDELVQLHTAVSYRVYMIGFQPGFPYMASVNERLVISRKQRPRQLVPEGSVGLAGVQTGVYPLDSPGGWQIIGRTPLKLFDKMKPNMLVIKPGDQVQFYAITLKEFTRLSNRRS
jgi:inhibitor of KinA